MEELEQVRAEIDRIDASLAALFEARMAAVAKIAAWKQANGRPIRDPAREAQVLAQGAERVAEPAMRPYYAAFQKELMALSRAYQASLGVCAGTLLPERGSLRRAAELLPKGCRVFVVTDSGVPAAYAETVAAQCDCAGVYVVPQGEASKSPETLTVLLEAMLRAGLTRSDCLAAVGGGMVCDLAGLAAGLYMRGVDSYYFPTTLLAMVDAAVGGKTAVNLAGVKNAVGLFRQPKAVVIDPDTLATLPPRQLANGLAEAMKMALTHDAALFARFEDPAGYGPIEEIIAACLRIKAAVVAADEREAGLRRVLNFGHTLGHGIEAAAGGSLLHGEAIALGMLPMCAPDVRARLIPVLERLDLPTYVNFELDMDKALEAICHDKKTTETGVETVTVPEIGQFAFQKAGLRELKALLSTLTRQQAAGNRQ